MKHKTAELEGALLDASVAKAEGLQVRSKVPGGALLADGWVYSPSSQWSDGGPIIDREVYCLPQSNRDSATWNLGKFVAETPGGFRYYGPTPLIAAMRAFVASKLGEEVEL